MCDGVALCQTCIEPTEGTTGPTSLHRIEPVTYGARSAAFAGSKAYVRADAQRTLLFDLNTAILSLSLVVPTDPALA